MTPAPALGRSALGPVDSKIRAWRWPRPVSEPNSPNRHAGGFAVAQATALKVSLYCAMPSGTGLCNARAMKYAGGTPVACLRRPKFR